MVQERLYSYDVLRVVAMTFVVATHSLMVVDVDSAIGLAYHHIALFFFITANALFFMLSGKFNLKVRNDKRSLRKFYFNRGKSFLLPIGVVFFIRILYDMAPNFGSVGHVLKTYAVNTLSLFSVTEYWFVFTLFGFLLVSPFLARMTQGMTRAECYAFVFIGLGFNVIMFVSRNTGIVFSWGYLFSGFALTFCIGGMMDRLVQSGRDLKRWIVASAICFLIGLVMYYRGWTSGALDISPFYTMTAIGIYLVVLHIGSKMKPSKIVSFLAQRSFSVYLVHVMVLNMVAAVLPSVDGAMSIVCHVVVSIVVLVGSVLAATVVDYAFVKPCQKLYDWVAVRLGTAVSRE